MPHSCFWTRGRVLEFQEIGAKYPKERVCPCYERLEAYWDLRSISLPIFLSTH